MPENRLVCNAYGRAEATIDALGNRTTAVFDTKGRQHATINPLGHRTSTVFDAYGRVSATVDALGGRTTLAYDSLSRRTNLIDSVGNKTTFVYDALSREIEQIDPHGQSATFAYDAVGRLASTTDRLDRRRDFTYDAVGQLTSEVWVSSLGGTDNRVTFTYDGIGNQLTGRDFDGAYTMVYDALGRVTQVMDVWNLLQTFTYDAVGNRTKVQDSLGGVTTSVYDAASNLSEREYGGSGPYLRLNFAYTDRDELKSVVRSDAAMGPVQVVRTSYTYDALGRMTNLHHRDNSGTSISNFTYTYDSASRVTNEVTNGTTKTYTYDNTDQLTADGTVTVTYDANGNRNNGSYATGTGNQITADGTWTYTYDAEGNMTKKSQGEEEETWFYGYDQRNQLIWAEKRAEDDPGSTLQMRADYKYDWNGNRIQKAVDTDGDTDIDITERYAYDWWKTGPQTSFVGNENSDVWADLNGSSSLTTRYLRGHVIDQIFARTDAGTSEAYWLLTDRLGSLRNVVDDTQTVKDNIVYDGWGNVTSESDPVYGGRYKWTGREFDVETELQYNRARFYDGKIGRWISRDPLGFEAGDSNLYRYVTNSPTNKADPSGLRSLTIEEQLIYAVFIVPLNGINQFENLHLIQNTKFDTMANAAKNVPDQLTQVLLGIVNKNQTTAITLPPGFTGESGSHVYWNTLPSTLSGKTLDTKSASIIAHELQHVVQQLRIPKGRDFVAEYVTQYANNMLKYNDDFKAYKNVSFESEAFAVEDAVLTILSDKNNQKRFLDLIQKYQNAAPVGPIAWSIYRDDQDAAHLAREFLKVMQLSYSDVMKKMKKSPVIVTSVIPGASNVNNPANLGGVRPQPSPSASGYWMYGGCASDTWVPLPPPPPSKGYLERYW